MNICRKRVLKNGAVGGYVKQKDGSWKWRFIKRGGVKVYYKDNKGVTHPLTPGQKFKYSFIKSKQKKTYQYIGNLNEDNSIILKNKSGNKPADFDNGFTIDESNLIPPNTNSTPQNTNSTPQNTNSTPHQTTFSNGLIRALSSKPHTHHTHSNLDDSLRHTETETETETKCVSTLIFGHGTTSTRNILSLTGLPGQFLNAFGNNNNRLHGTRFTPENGTNFITMTDIGDNAVILQGYIFNAIQQLYSDNKTLFLDGDKSTRLSQSGIDFQNYLNKIIRNNAPGHSEFKFKNHIGNGQTKFNNMLLDFIPHTRVNESSLGMYKLCVGKRKTETGKPIHQIGTKKNILLSELLQLMGPGNYIIFSCRGSDTNTQNMISRKRTLSNEYYNTHVNTHVNT